MNHVRFSDTLFGLSKMGLKWKEVDKAFQTAVYESIERIFAAENREEECSIPMASEGAVVGSLTKCGLVWSETPKNVQEALHNSIELFNMPDTEKYY